MHFRVPTAVLGRFRRFCVSTIVAVLVAGPGLADATDGQVSPIIVDTKGKGPGLKVVAFMVNPELTTRPANRIRFLSAASLEAIADDTFGANQLLQQEAALKEGWSQFGVWFGASGAFGTLAEHVGKFEGLGGVNNALTNLGLFMTIWQVGLDLSNGDNSAAGQSAYKGLMGFTVGKWGWSTLQAASVVWFVVDVTLTEFGQTAWLARTDYWRQVYTSYYRQRDKSARAAELGPQPDHLRPTLDQRLKEMRAREEGGRSINEWKVLLTHYFRSVSRPERFASVLEAELDLYVSKFWTSPRFDEFVAEFGRANVGLAKGASLTEGIKKLLEDEHKAALKAMFVKKIFPEIAHRAFLDALALQSARLNREMLPVLNATFDIDVSAYDLKTPARFSMPLPSGGSWSGTLNPGQTRTLRITKLAFMLAGLPEDIVLQTENGEVRTKISFVGDKGSAVFGQPKSTFVTVLNKTESSMNCDRRETDKTGKVTSRQETRPARSSSVVHTATTADLKNVLFGFYDLSGGWTIASPGALGDDDTLRFAAPHFENIVALKGCSAEFLKGGALSGGTCRIERSWRETVSENAEVEFACRSEAEFSIKGIYMPQGGQMQYVAFDGPQGELILNTLKEAMKKGLFAPGGFHQ